MTVAYKLIKFLSIALFGLLIVGCSREASGVSGAHFSAPAKLTFSFKPGLPKEIQGTYYRSELSSGKFSDDEFYKLSIDKNDVFIKKYGVKGTQSEGTKLYSHKISKGVYIIQDYWDRYNKVILTKSGNIEISHEFNRYDDAVNSEDMTEFYHHKPDVTFGLSPSDLDNTYYTSDDDFTRYYDFDVAGSNYASYVLWQINPDGTESIMERYNHLVAKKGRYNLFNDDGNDEKYTTLSKIGKDKLQDAETGETFTLYKGKGSPKEQAWDLLHVQMKPPVIEK
ncbi:hypothetical protein [Companilactobacillus ginsenosidimutans]|uniref:Lipoprotein n=1 Tax=Companilactobacillus ginsenosidimutans TaxID=1007676 RepID=A0A0H4QIB9_9LACO|nr:hypothetical protein [Companilactobacillus ginsenosidimutans]AKP67692.1 hypothetical protein ABM34_09235 [Companilactobacillus ginsenosidimutans]